MRVREYAPQGDAWERAVAHWRSVASDPDAAERAARLIGRVREFSEMVTAAGTVPGRIDGRVAYHRSCHMLRELGIDDQPISLLRDLEGCETVEWADESRSSVAVRMK